MLIFKTRDPGHEIKLPYRMQTCKNHEEKLSIIQNFKKNNQKNEDQILHKNK
jgi:hypothetical protein